MGKVSGSVVKRGKVLNLLSRRGMDIAPGRSREGYVSVSGRTDVG